ncbi:MAG: PA2169 family four-helix-bundle protein [Brevundimonas sp.]|uniref:PA2169 family four-helix-bundle protein n=1 Tax=Brevundimonas sp. TaxID=1871086 RepID=UPI002615D718|nr:PA2169 family four-helix-bundle protein [Brevundimonas sp.]MDI6624514.1 PA2169 family four-helix-bundle protein [Brevundimonas sp.]MDQ7813359.1 PA2169 family four-helix-bundle protein [Brevundimonas sp.]
MSNANRHDVHVLNDLIQTALDSADGYREASIEAADPGHRDLFGRRSFERRQVAEELQSTVRALGGDPAAEGSVLAKAQRAFADIKHALMRDDASMIGAVESAEEAVRARFEKALEDSRISATTRETIRRAFVRVSRGRDDIHDLRHSLEGQRDAANPLFPH